MRKAFLVIGLQNDFCAGGAKAVADAERVMVPVAALGSAIDHAGDLVIAHREIHRESSEYFTTQGGEVEPYCVEGTRGAAFHRGVSLTKRTRLIYRTDDPEHLGHSAFHAADRSGTKLDQILRDAGVTELLIGGVPTERAIRSTALDAVRRGYQVTVIQDAVAALDSWRGRDVLASLAMSGVRVTSAGDAIVSLYQSGEVRLFHGH